MSIETNSQTTGRRSDDDFGTPPQSRVEQVLMNEQIKPQSRIEKLLLEGGGGGGTSDYTQLTNKPSINGTILIGNKTLADLGIAGAWRGTRAQYEEVKATIPPNTFVDITDEPDMDNFPTQGSLNPVTSNGLYTELSKLKVINENPENHNGIYRGKDLTNIYTIEQIYERVHDGSFEDLYLGDYFTVRLTTDLMTRFTGSAFESGVTYYEMDSGTDVTQRTWTVTQDETPQEGKVYATKQVIEEDVDYMIAGFDMYMHAGQSGDSYIKYHHVVMVPKIEFITVAKYHHDPTAMIGYATSDIFNITLPCYAASLKRATNGHILVRRSRRTSSTDPNAPSGAGSGWSGSTNAMSWVNSELDLLNTMQVFGNGSFSSSWRDTASDYFKLPLYNYVNLRELDDLTDNHSTILCNIVGVISGELYVATLQGGGTLNAGKTTLAARFGAYFLFG